MTKRCAPNANIVHFIGIGGIGMSALARYFLSTRGESSRTKGWSVSGSDLSPSSITDELEKEGARIHIGKHSANNVPREVNLVIYNQAILSDNIELQTARKLTIVCQSYPEAIGKLTHHYKTIAIAGAHGKSTTTAMTALILIKAGLDPTVIVGTKLKELGNKNFRRGGGPYLVLEADEWKGSFWHYSPFIGAITNIDKEHLDFYKNFSNVKKAFARFKKQCQHVVTHSTDPKVKTAIKKILKVPGEHNLKNALLAYSIGRKLNIPRSTILRTLSKYTGAWRRMEFRGYLQFPTSHILHLTSNFKVFDDYAHHPTEIRATLAGFRQKWPQNPLICVFQAHQLERLKLLYNDFKTAFKEANKVIILPTYTVAGRENSAKRGQPKASSTIGNLSKKLAHDIGAEYLENPKRLKMFLADQLFASRYPLSPIVVMMGAGDIVRYTNLLIK